MFKIVLLLPKATVVYFLKNVYHFWKRKALDLKRGNAEFSSSNDDLFLKHIQRLGNRMLAET